MADNLYDYLNRFTLGDIGRQLGNIKPRLSPEQMRAASAARLVPGGQPAATRPPMPGLPVDYKQTELAAGAAAERFRPGAGFPGQQAAADRAYETEKSRVAQLTAQDPELQRYENARKLAAAPGATPGQVQSAENIGMQMWAKANPTLAAKVKPGQAGYEAIQGVLSAGTMGAPADLPFNQTNVLGGTPMPQGLSYENTTPTAIPGGTPIKGGGFSAAPAAMFERFLKSQAPTAIGLEASPLGTAQPLGALNYGGAVQPLGTSIDDDFYKSEKAQQLARMFANSRIVQ